eukprot:TRINITY_DN1408_c0_g2_i1.p1 TRINITY_DN1408_c0_g2~~TRINITY_DN1408_c0_g2_i1.p1  ORF type:complete len:266 (+),score=76.12 TRINITY_DN1408_c0_g2_i1:139-936(+)
MSAKRTGTATRCVAAVVCGVAGHWLLGNASKSSSGFLQPLQPSEASPLAVPQQQGVQPGMQTQVPESTGTSTGSCFLVATAAVGLAAAAAAKSLKPQPPRPSYVSMVPAETSFEGHAFVNGAISPVACVAAAGASGDEALVAMAGVPKRKHVRITERTRTDLRRGISFKAQKSAKVRFLIKQDGSIWRRQAGLRHLKSKKTPKHLKRLSKLVKVDKKWYTFLQPLLKHKPAKTKVSDLIMRKFNEQRLKKREGLSDRHVGHSLWA